jgi:hypothetical protein
VLVGALTVGVGFAAVGGVTAVGGLTNAKPDPALLVTEDNDTNDGGTPNNVVDDGDNQHPSGNDRSVEHGGSGNQGKTPADPDDDTRGPDRTNRGVDQPGGPGGDDLADQDGNNGCGNDDDFEDDNEGHCRGRTENYVGGQTPDRGNSDKNR